MVTNRIANRARLYRNVENRTPQSSGICFAAHVINAIYTHIKSIYSYTFPDDMASNVNRFDAKYIGIVYTNIIWFHLIIVEVNIFLRL